jgi:hypothetical protein
MALLQHVLILAEPLLLLAVLGSLIRSGGAHRFPALVWYLCLRLVTEAYLVVLLYVPLPPTGRTVSYTFFFYSYYACYVICAVAIFFVIQEIFSQLMEPVPGLQRLGLLAFRWIAIISAVISVVVVALPANSSTFQLHLAALQLMRCVSILELCLLVFLVLAIQSFGRSFKSRLFGIAFGFGVQAATELVMSAVVARHPGLNSTANGIVQIFLTLTLMIWTAYFLMPEPAQERSKIVLPTTSPLLRWNEIAKALGHSAPQIAVGSASSGFFLQDVEQVVDKVMARNALNAKQ